MSTLTGDQLVEVADAIFESCGDCRQPATITTTRHKLSPGPNGATRYGTSVDVLHDHYGDMETVAQVFLPLDVEPVIRTLATMVARAKDPRRLLTEGDVALVALTLLGYQRLLAGGAAPVRFSW